MIHIKLFEDFDPAEDEGPSYYVLKDGRFLAFYEEPFEDMAGETNYMYKYFVGDKPGDKDYEKFKEVSWKDIKDQLTPEDLKQHEKEREDLGDSNNARSVAWVK